MTSARVGLSISLVLLGSALLLLAPATARAGEDVDRQIEEGTLDWIHLLAGPPSAESVVVVRLFDASEADLGTGGEGGKKKRVEAATMMQEQSPPILAEALVAKLKALGPFANVLQDSGEPLPETALVVEGRFTTLNPGSRAKRYWAGFGAGKGVMEMEGTVKSASGELLAEFRQKRLTVMGAFGGDYERKMKADSERFGHDIAEFLHRWATGKKLEG